MHTYIVTVTAADRVGIIHAVTGAISEQGGTIKELSQTVLRGYFTIILAVEFDGPRDPKGLREAVHTRGERFDLNVAVIPDEGRHVDPVPGGERFILTVLGQDRPGTIHRIAGSLARRGVNIVDLHARTEGPRFSLVMEAYLPPELGPAELRGELEQFGAELGMEVYLQHENIFLATNEPRPVRVGSARNPEGSDVVVPH
ncbi:glycine cleavage system protein R [Tautonia sociabilis]|uniref:ACT domain-containing protein n=1 Tax=Tautonia sociabilis TaxID=2080755 RepID=A0A432MG52_9BACT|nr:ACT domain-containing protein [Tautonia sociabilis]RUL85529.1 ACT domain-containing protein [Tautonia sociabilis]